MIDCGEVTQNKPEHFKNRMSLLAHKHTAIDCIVKEPGLIAIVLLHKLQSQVNIVNRIQYVDIRIKGRLVATYRTQATFVDNNPRFVARFANGICHLAKGGHL